MDVGEAHLPDELDFRFAHGTLLDSEN